MKYLHPKKTWHRLVDVWHQCLFRMWASRIGVDLVIGENVKLRDCCIASYNGACGCSLIIADGADLCGVTFSYFGSNGIIRIGGG